MRINICKPVGITDISRFGKGINIHKFDIQVRASNFFSFNAASRLTCTALQRVKPTTNNLKKEVKQIYLRKFYVL